MTSRRVILSKRAQADLDAIELYVTRETSEATAERFIDAIVDHCESFHLFPERGTRLRNGVRKIGWRKRITILFKVRADRVEIVSIAYRGRRVD